MSELALAEIVLAFCLCACVFAFVKGGTAERVGAAIILLNLVAGLANEYLKQSQLITLVIDGGTAVGLLVVAMRYASPWLGAVMLLYALQFALDAYYFVLERPRDLLHVVLNNADFCGINLALFAGTLTAWLRRRRLSAAPPVLPEAAP